MKKQPLFTGLILGGLGLIGVFSLLTSEVPVDNLPSEALALYTPEQLRWMMLLNPFILLTIAVVVGSLLYRRTELGVPLIHAILEKKFDSRILKAQLKWAVILGIPTGLFLYYFSEGAAKIYSAEFSELSSEFTPSIPMKILYGGITEEIQLRFGLMTLFVWLLLLATKRLNNFVFWTGIILSSLLFGAGHLGVLFQSIDSPSAGMILYVILGNSVAGIAFGWLYWKKGLESSMMAHILTHVTMIVLLAI